MREPLTFEIPAKELRPGDYVFQQGVVGVCWVKGTVLANIGGRPKILKRDQLLTIHIEDHLEA